MFFEKKDSGTTIMRTTTSCISTQIDNNNNDDKNDIRTEQQNETLQSSVIKVTRTTTSSPRMIKMEQQQQQQQQQQQSDEQEQKQNSTSSYPAWHNMVAGGIAGAGSRMITAPLDLIRIRRQLATTSSFTGGLGSRAIVTYPSPTMYQQIQTIIRTEEGGIQALYRGNLIAIYLWITYAAVQFTIYNTTKQYLLSVPSTTLPSPSISSSSFNSTMTTTPTATNDNTMTHLNHSFLSTFIYTIRSSLAVSPTAVSFISGSIAGLCATAVTYPFDVCRTTFVAKGFVTNHINSSVSSLSQQQHQATPTQQQTMPSVSHPSPSPIPTHHNPMNSSSSSTATGTTGGTMKASIPMNNYSIHNHSCNNNSVASSISTTTTTTTTTTHTTKVPPRTMYEFVRQLYLSNGLQGFYAGSLPALIQIIPYMGINFAIYDRLTNTNHTNDNTNNNNSTSVTLSAYAGSIAGGISKFIVYPLDTVKRRLQAQSFYGTTTPVTTTTTTTPSAVVPSHPYHQHYHHHPSSSIQLQQSQLQQLPYYYNNMFDCIRKIIRYEGYSSFYRGFVPSVLKSTISTSIAFGLFRFTKNILEKE